MPAIAIPSATATARAATVDGISDQSLPNWDGGFGSSAFAQQFRERWVATGHITYARYVLQWNALSNRGEEPYTHYAQEFERWWADVKALNLTPVLAFYNYCPAAKVPRACAAALPSPPSEAAYTSAIEGVLSNYRPAVVEPWNEPNDDEIPEALAARFAQAASTWCASNACTAIAGDLIDQPGGAAYESRYLADLSAEGAPRINDWGIHPYYALNSDAGSAEAEAMHDELRGEARTMWITEIGAYYCNKGALVGEAEQQARARRLVDELAPRLEASYTFYYEFLRGNRERAPCESGGTQEDSALYSPDDTARAAASVIFEGGAPAGTTGGVPPSWWSGFTAALG